MPSSIFNNCNCTQAECGTGNQDCPFPRALEITAGRYLDEATGATDRKIKLFVPRLAGQ
jgi:hypothetical protein